MPARPLPTCPDMSSREADHSTILYFRNHEELGPSLCVWSVHVRPMASALTFRKYRHSDGFSDAALPNAKQAQCSFAHRETFINPPFRLHLLPQRRGQPFRCPLPGLSGGCQRSPNFSVELGTVRPSCDQRQLLYRKHGRGAAADRCWC